MSSRLSWSSKRHSLAAELFAHAVVVLEHHAVGLQVELVVVEGVLAEAHTAVFVHDAAHLYDLAALQAEFVLVPDHFRVVVVALRDLQLVIRDALNAADKGDCAANEATQVRRADERVRLPVDVLDLLFSRLHFSSFYVRLDVFSLLWLATIV